jgi:hypothetical protein
MLSKFRGEHNATIAPTLAWLAADRGIIFDCYFDSYHQGLHFPGGDWRRLDEGHLTGGTVAGDRHFSEFCWLLMNFDVSVVSLGRTLFSAAVKHFEIPVISESLNFTSIYKKIFAHLKHEIPLTIAMIGNYGIRHLPGTINYLYPEIVFRKAVGVPESISDDELEALCGEDAVIKCCFVSPERIGRLQKSGYKVEIVESGQRDYDYQSITKRIALRWQDRFNGWILGDPPLVLHWLPTACSEGLFSIYGTPQSEVLKELKDQLSLYSDTVYGRQYSDSDFFDLSKMNCSFQVIDPCRPPFQSCKHIQYTWQPQEEGFYGPEYRIEELKRFARENRIMISLVFWTGMIRELSNLYNLMDLIAVTKMKCGLVLTAASFEFMMHQPLELMTIPVDQGGVYPLTEPLLGSCGTGVAIESSIDRDKLLNYLNEGMRRIREKVVDSNYLPRGWWTTMDTRLEKRSHRELPKPISFRSYTPHVQLRYHKKDKIIHRRESDSHDTSMSGRSKNIGERFKERMRAMNLDRFFSHYRPYEFYQAGDFNHEMATVASSAGLRYMFTKAGFGMSPQSMHLDDNFIALNYTAGQWDGWTPFETINHLTDLQKAEKRLLKNSKPGWLVGTIDSCLWTFGGEFWNRGKDLLQIAEFCAKGGSSGKLINARPHTISQYAHIIAKMKEQNKP